MSASITKDWSAAQQAWGDGIVKIAAAHTNGGDFTQVAGQSALCRPPRCSSSRPSAEIQFPSTSPGLSTLATDYPAGDVFASLVDAAFRVDSTRRCRGMATAHHARGDELAILFGYASMPT